MENKKKIRSILFITITFAFSLTVGIMESIPDHRVGYQDYSWWTFFEVYPLLFLAHGILSGVVLTKTMKVLYLISTPIMICAAFFVNRLGTPGLTIFDCLLSGLVGGMLYTFISLVGLILCVIVRKTFVFLRTSRK